MKIKFYSQLIISLFVFNASFAQSIFKGAITNFNTNAKTDFNFTLTFATIGTQYISTYKLIDIADGKQFASITVVNEKPTAKIKVQLIVNADTSRFEINYSDSLGSIFGLKGTFKKEPVNKYPLSLAFLTENKTYLKVNQVIRKNTALPEHFLLERIFADDLITNTTLLSKYKGTQPTGTANKILSMTDFGVPNANATNPVQQNPNPVTALPVVTSKENTSNQPVTTVTNSSVNAPGVTAPIVTVPVAPQLIKIKPTNSNVKDFSIDSIRTILKPVQNEMVSVQLFISGGTSNYTVAKEGIEALAINWGLQGGTKTLTAEQVQIKMEQLGIDINYKLTPDYSIISMNCLRKQFDDSWQIFTDLIARTGFQADVFETVRDEVSNNSSGQNGFDVLQQIALSYSFVGKQYDKNPVGSTASISKLTAEEVKKYYASIMVRKRFTLVVCGNFSADELNQKIRTGFKGIVNGTNASTSFGGVDFNGSAFKFVSANDNGVNRILGIAAAPDAGSIDETELTIALSILNSRINTITEQKTNLLSDYDFAVAGYRQNFCLLKLTAVDPEKAIQVIIDEIKKAKKLGFTADELQTAKDHYITSYYLQNESNEAIAKTTGKSEMNDTWEDAENLYATINNLVLTDVNAALRKYIKGFRFYYSGDKDAANEIIFTQKLE